MSRFLLNFAFVKPVRMNASTIFRLVCLTALWVILCYLLIQGRGFNLWSLFVIVASGIVVFVPLYKKHLRNGKGKA